MFFRKITTKKNGREYVYVKLIENYRQEGKVKQRVIANFGSMENLSSDRINYLIASLRKLHNEVRQPSDQDVPVGLTTKVNEIREAIDNCNIKKTMSSLFGDKMYQMAEAILVKAIMASEVRKPIQEVCKGLGLVDTTSLQFYNIMKRIGEEDTKEVLLKDRLAFAKGNENIHNPIVIHVFKSQFEGHSFDVDTTNNVYLPENYCKQIYVLMALDYQGNLLDFEHADNQKELSELLSYLIHRLNKHISSQIVVLDEENCVKEHRDYLLAQRITETSEQLNNTNEIKVIRYSQISDSQIKEIKAKLAKVAAGLEHIKADVLLGKMTKEQAVRKKADQIIKSNECGDLVSYSINESIQTFNYEINEEILMQKKQSKLNEPWGIINSDLVMPLQINELHIKTNQFYHITDQLNIPPINLYVDYHYSPEIISGHIQLEMLKTQVQSALHKNAQGGEAIN
ncbi:hypothetical protein [Desulfotomaculum sp. 1211_IL3151]|uniref:hypothetical protein n=1 Tax=Desulfotomaculum sp. 1211_IL3151 TaxID=3084055 RepID=UPI002FD8AAA1